MTAETQAPSCDSCLRTQGRTGRSGEVPPSQNHTRKRGTKEVVGGGGSTKEGAFPFRAPQTPRCTLCFSVTQGHHPGSTTGTVVQKGHTCVHGHTSVDGVVCLMKSSESRTCCLLVISW